MPDLTPIEIEALRKDFYDKHQAAEKAAYAYCCALPVGPDRERAFTVYDQVRCAPRVIS
ncbi:hypothetical protein Lumi_038 [Xylophilus phage Lumi]|nr:hypothetical protein Lumi_038 [Xylophilus phage Lumi]